MNQQERLPDLCSKEQILNANKKKITMFKITKKR